MRGEESTPLAGELVPGAWSWTFHFWSLPPFPTLSPGEQPAAQILRTCPFYQCGREGSGRGGESHSLSWQSRDGLSSVPPDPPPAPARPSFDRYPPGISGIVTTVKNKTKAWPESPVAGQSCKGPRLRLRSARPLCLVAACSKHVKMWRDFHGSPLL